MFSGFFKLHKRYQIAQSVTNFTKRTSKTLIKTYLESESCKAGIEAESKLPKVTEALIRYLAILEKD